MFGMTFQTAILALRSNFVRYLCALSFGDFYRLCFDYFGFSLILKNKEVQY